MRTRDAVLADILRKIVDDEHTSLHPAGFLMMERKRDFHGLPARNRIVHLDPVERDTLRMALRREPTLEEILQPRGNHP